MRKFSVIFLLLGALLMVAAAMVSAADDAAKTEEAPAHQYVGPAKCKLCHKAEYTAWSETKHANAFAALSAEDQKKPECVQCHITGTDEKGEVIDNVTCEACHGPGSDYKSPKIMSKKKFADDPKGALKAAQEAGLVMPPTEETCMRCHKKEGNPNFKPFDYEKMKLLVHPVKAEGK